jgi:hypothetical protein
MYIAVIERICTKAILQKRPPLSLPTAPRIARSGDGVVPFPDAKRCATPHAVEGVPTQATLGWIPRSSYEGPPREITRQEKSAGEGGSRKDEIGAAYRACRRGSSSPRRRRWPVGGTPPRHTLGALLLAAAAGVSTPRCRSGWPCPLSCCCSMAAPPSRSEMVWARW